MTDIDIADPAIEAYAADHTTPEPPWFAELAAETRASTEAPNMMVGTLEGRLLKGADEFEQPHPVQAAQDRLDVSFPADHLHLRHGDEHRLTPRSCRRSAG